MSAIRFCWNNLLTVPGVVVASSSALSTLPNTNAILPDRTLVWRSTSTTGDQWVSFDLGAAAAVTVLAIANPKLQTGGTLKLQRSPDNTTWTDVATLPAADVDTKVTFVFFGSISFRYWRIYFTNVGAVSDYVEVGYAFVGTYFEPANNVVGPLPAPLVDNSVVTKSLAGQRSTTVRPQQSTGTFTWESLTESDRGALQQIFRAQGQGLPSFCVLATAISWTAWLLYFGASSGATVALSRTFTIADTFYDVAVDWEEAL